MSLIEGFNKDGKNIINYLRDELGDIVLLDKSKMLGKEYSLGKTSNPLHSASGLGLST